VDLADALQRLSRAPGLKRIPEADRRRLVGKDRLRHLARGDRLFEEGSDGQSAYVILRGSLSILRELGDGVVAPIALRGVGEWVGELALLDGGLRSASVVADSETWVLEIPRDSFVELLGRHPEVAIELAAAIGRRLRESDGALAEALQKRLQTLATENRRLARALARKGSEGELSDEPFFPGSSAASERVRRGVLAAARSELAVLIRGEAGTGKETLARAIHARGERAARRFVAVDCALFPGRALEAEIFGLAAGGLPGAASVRRGAVEEADGGTLFLAAIDALTPWLQGLLAHFLRDGEYRRVGENRVRSSDVRLVAATAEDLGAAVREGRFRSDLFEAIHLLRIDVPPLRARRADIPTVVDALLLELGADAEEPALQLSSGALGVFTRHEFAGNQRELRALLERLIAEHGPGARISPLDVSRAIPGAKEPWPDGYSEAVRAFKTQLVSNALEHAGGSRTEAARILALHPSNLIRLIRNLGV